MLRSSRSEKNFDEYAVRLSVGNVTSQSQQESSPTSSIYNASSKKQLGLRRVMSSHLINAEEAQNLNGVPCTYNGGKTKQHSVIVKSFLLSHRYRHIIFLVLVLTTMLTSLAAILYLGGIHRLAMSNAKQSFFGGAVHEGYFNIENSKKFDHNGEKSFAIAAVSDLDQLSRVSHDKVLFRAILELGQLKSYDYGEKYSIIFNEQREVIAGQNEAGRGMELSELTVYQNRLLTIDDRTGTVFEVLNRKNGVESYVVPRHVITAGNGEVSKGAKLEWSTVKENDLYLGSTGKEYTLNDGTLLNTHSLWITIISPTLGVRRVDWTKQYTYVREQLGASFPGYCIHEAILWSEHLKKWLFLPRRISSQQYDEVADERRGSNKLLLVDEYFKSSQIVEIKMKTVDPLHGFSSIAFVPETNDRHALALRSVEENCVGGLEDKCSQRTYALVFETMTGKVIMDEQLLPTNFKFEGVEFVDLSTPEPI